MTELLISGASAPGPDGAILSVVPESAGFDYVGFEVLALEGGGTAERECGIRELCVVVISGVVHVASEHGEWYDWAAAPTRGRACPTPPTCRRSRTSDCVPARKAPRWPCAGRPP